MIDAPAVEDSWKESIARLPALFLPGRRRRRGGEKFTLPFKLMCARLSNGSVYITLSHRRSVSTHTSATTTHENPTCTAHLSFGEDGGGGGHGDEGGAGGGRGVRGGGGGRGAAGVQRARHVPLLPPCREQLGPRRPRRERLLRHVGRQQAVLVALQVRLDRLLRARGSQGPGLLRQMPLGDEHGDGGADHGEDRGPVRQRRAGPGLGHGVQQDRHQWDRLPAGPSQRQLPVRRLPRLD